VEKYDSPSCFVENIQKYAAIFPADSWLFLIYINGFSMVNYYRIERMEFSPFGFGG
jgi:hypothetical protein